MKQEKTINHGAHGAHGEMPIKLVQVPKCKVFPMSPVCPVVKKPFAS